MRNMPAVYQRFGDSDSFWSQRREDMGCGSYIHPHMPIIEQDKVYVSSFDMPAVFLYISPRPVGFVVSEGSFYRFFLLSGGGMQITVDFDNA
jgi:hypothetical protein